MSEARTMDPRHWVVRIGIALVQGLLLWWLYDAAANDRWPEDRHGWLAGLITVAVIVPGIHYLLADLASAARQRLVLLALALLSLGLGWHHGAWTADAPYREPVSFVLPLGVLLFLLLPFVQSALTRGALRPRYEDLFHFAWRNALLAALGAVFTGVFWLLLVLWGGLFQMIGIDFFHELFESARFAIPATAVAVGVGLQLAGSVERLQTALRQQLLAMLKWLAPLAILILVLFTGALLAKSPELFAEQRRAISAAWLLWLVALTVTLLNAAYQDGNEPSPYPRWLGAAIRFASLLLLPVALLAVYALGVAHRRPMASRWRGRGDSWSRHRARLRRRLRLGRAAQGRLDGVYRRGQRRGRAVRDRDALAHAVAAAVAGAAGRRQPVPARARRPGERCLCRPEIPDRSLRTRAARLPRSDRGSTACRGDTGECRTRDAETVPLATKRSRTTALQLEDLDVYPPARCVSMRT